MIALQSMIENYLKIQLLHSESSTDTGCPIYVPQLGVEELHRFAEQAAKHSEHIGECLDPRFFTVSLSIFSSCA